MKRLFPALLTASALALVCNPETSAAVWNYDFRDGLNTNVWTFNSSGATTWSHSTTSEGLLFSGPAGGGDISAASLSLDLTKFDLAGDFDATIAFSGGTFGPGWCHQLHFGTTIEGSSIYAVRSNEGDGLHLWLGYYADGPDGASGADGSLRINRTGTTVSTYWNDSPTAFWSGTYGTTAPTSLAFNLQKNSTTDASQVTWKTFTLVATAIPEPATTASLLGAAALLLGVARRFRRRTARD